MQEALEEKNKEIENGKRVRLRLKKMHREAMENQEKIKELIKARQQNDLEKSANSNAPTGDSIYDRVQNDPN